MKNKDEKLIVKLLPFILNRSTNINYEKIPYGVSMIKAQSLWSASNKGEGVNIAVIDSGCDINHESLKGNIIGVKNFTDEDGKDSNIVIDRVGHGTHVTGTIVGNGSKIFGVAPKASIYVLKVIDRTGSGNVNWIINAIYYAIEKKVDIISMSLGMAKNSDRLEKAIKEAVRNNILVVCAAGNEGNGNAKDFEYSYPAAYQDVISVGAIDRNRKPANFSNSNPVVDVVAPGIDIISTYPNNLFALMSGTSMATPHVTGSLALLKNWSRKEFKRELTQEEIYAQLVKHTVAINVERTVQGNGLVYLKENKVKKTTKY